MSRAATERRVLDEAGGWRAMTGVMAVMLFLTVLAAAAGLGAAGAGRLIDRQLAGRLTVQVIQGSPTARDAAAARLLAVLKTRPEVRRAALVDRADLTRLLAPWLGTDAADPELPVPALIDIDLRDADEETTTRIAGLVRRVAPDAQLDRRERWMSPVGAFMRSVVMTTAALVLLMMAATAAVVMLAARAGLETHRATIEVMHILGSTDVQVARLFQRRMAIDAALGGGTGALAALGVVVLLGMQLRDMGSELLGGVALSLPEWLALAALPLLFVALAMLAARQAVLGTLRRLP